MNRRVILFWVIIGGAAALRVISSLYQHAPDMGACLKQQVEGGGVINDDPVSTESGQMLVIDVVELMSGDAECASRVLIKMKTKSYPRYAYGDRIHFSGKLSIPFNFKSETGRSFDYRGYLAKDDIFYEIKSATISLEESSHGFGVTSFLYKIKRGFVDNLKAVLGEPHAALAAGLVVGEKSSLGKDLIDDFRTVGLIHIVVLSGFNITIVAAALRRSLSFLPRAWGIAIGGIGIILFGVLVGGGATVIRSCCMALVALLGDMIRRDYSAARALAFAACLMLIQNPMILLHDPSFQLSFLATLGLVLLAAPMEKAFQFVPDTFGLRGICASTIATQIFVSPYILYMMGQVSIIGMIVNILVLPVIPVTMLLVFLAGLSGFLSEAVSQLLGWGAHLLLSYELSVVEHFARVPFAAATVPPFSGWWVAGFYTGFLVLYFLASLKFFSITDQFRFAKKSST